MNTPKHVALQKALGFETPRYAHLPLIFNPDGSKMSKRDKDKAVRAEVKRRGDEATERRKGDVSEQEFARWLKDKSRQLPADALQLLAADLGVELPEIEVDDFRRSGYLPDVVCNYIALLGWNPGVKNEDGTDLERFDPAYLASNFSLERVGKKPSKFDREKLRAFNADTIQKDLSPEAFAAAWRGWLERYEPGMLETIGDRLDMAAAAVQPRATTLADAIDAIRFVLIADDAVEFDDKAVNKALTKNDGEGLAALARLTTVIESITPFEPEPIEAAIKAWCEAEGVGMGKAAQPLRVAITGAMVSPGLGQTLALIGRDGAATRVRRCLEVCGPR